MTTNDKPLYAKAKKLRQESECLFNHVDFKCKSQGKHPTEKNHIISKSYLKKISEKNLVMNFNWEQRDYYKNGGELSLQNIKKVNVYNVLCGYHDNLLFNEIEKGKFYTGTDQQNFQFALRAFLFNYAHCKIKNNSDFNGITPGFANKVGDAQFGESLHILGKFKKLYLGKNWSGVKSVVIRVDKKINFVSCFYAKPFYNIGFPCILTTGEIAINIFPDENETIILLSYFENAPKTIVSYCKKLHKYSTNNEDKFIQYMNKVVVSFDPNIAIKPSYWENMTPESQRSFYKCASLFKKTKSFTQGIKNIFKLYFYKCKFNLFEK